MDFHQMCPRYEKAMELLGKRWTGLILRALMEGPRRFGEIAAYVEGLSDRLLSERLQELEEAGVVQRTVKAQRPIAVYYALTPKGTDLRRVVEAVQEWADRWAPAQEASGASALSAHGRAAPARSRPA